MGGATSAAGSLIRLVAFQSTLPVGGATASGEPADAEPGISIHAPRGGSDPLAIYFLAFAKYFNPRSPWGERLEGADAFMADLKFQSTLPVGGATAPETTEEQTA